MKQRSEETILPLRWASALLSLPESPGVYWFSDEDGKVLYVGKAKNLKKRVSSYALLSRAEGKTLKLVTEAARLKYAVLQSELEALLVEAELIRAHQPQYNILLKDDKSPLYICVTSEEFPRVLTVRKKSALYTKHKGTFFGPFPSAGKVRQVLRIARGIFRWCSDANSAKKPCFYYHINLCSGTCAGKISKEEYAQMVRYLKSFLHGKTSQLVTAMKKEMREASARREYEKAGQYRDQIAMIQEVTQQKTRLGPDFEIPHLAQREEDEMVVQLRRLLSQYISLPKQYALHRIEGYDISNTQGARSVASMVVFTDGRVDKQEYKNFHIRLGETPNDYAMLQEALVRRQNHPEWGIPDLVVIDGGKGQLHSALSVWEWSVPVVSLAKKPDRLFVYNTALKKFAEHALQDRDFASTLLRRVRDESHRFAKRLHARRRTQSVIR